MSNRPLLTGIVAGAIEWAVILLPVAVYLLVLAFSVNRRRHPVAVGGRINFLFLVLAMSGFLLLGPLSWIAHLFRPADSAEKFFPHAPFLIAYGIYAAIVVAISALLIYRQRNSLVIYNIDPNDLAGVLEEVLAAMDVPHSITPGRVAFDDGNLVLDIEPSFLLNNVAMHWIYGGKSELRWKIEENLRKALRDVDAGPNPASTILGLAASVLLTFILFASVLYYLTFWT